MDIYDLFEKESGITITTNFLERLQNFRMRYITMVNRQVNHPSFYGGHYIGTYPVRFFEEHRSELLVDILNLEPLYVKRELDKIDGIDPSRRVQSDLMNQALVWLAHKFYISSLKPDEKHSGMVCCFQLMHYRFLGSLSQHYFKFPGKEEIDIATYASLSRKFYLKQEGSWGGVVNRRSKDVIDPNGIHADVFEKYDDLKDILDCINDVQSRIREQWKGIFVKYLEAKEAGNRIDSTTSTAEIDGEKVFMDQQRYQDEYMRYAHTVCNDETSFVKREIINAVVKEFPRLPDDHLEDILTYICENYSRDKKLPKMVEELILHMFEYIGSDKSKARSIKDVPTLVYQLKGVYTAPRASDPNLLKMREEFEALAKKITRVKTGSTIASLRTGTMLYIVIRTLAKNYYV